MIGHIVQIKITQTIYEEWAINLITQERIRERIDDYEARLQLMHMQHELEATKERALKEAGWDIHKMGLEVVKSLALRKWFIWGER